MALLDELFFTALLREGPLWVVSIQRLDVNNALNARANRELGEVFDAFVADAEARVAILTNYGPTFCSGHDYRAARARGRIELPPSGFGGLTRRFDNPKPIIAAVNGDALDEGFELALACDLIVAHEEARFSLQQALWGRAPTEGGVHRLLRQVPLKKAMASLLTGASISAAEGVLLGFVNDIVSSDRVLPLAREWAARILKLSPQSVHAVKQMAMQGSSHGSLGDALADEYPELEKLFASEGYAGSVARLAAESGPR